MKTYKSYIRKVQDFESSSEVMLSEGVDVHKELVSIRKSMDAAIATIMKKKLNLSDLNPSMARSVEREFKQDVSRLSDAARVFAKEMRDFWEDWNQEFS